MSIQFSTAYTFGGNQLSTFTQEPIIGHFERETGRLSGIGRPGVAGMPVASATLAAPFRNRAVVVGDSRAGYTAAEGGAALRQVYNRGLWHHLQGLSGNYWNLVQCAGVVSDRIDQVVSRWGSTTPGELFGGVEVAGVQFGVQPFSPDWIFCEVGINDILQGIAGTHPKALTAGAQTAAQIVAIMKASAEDLIALMEASGAKCIWFTEGAVASGAAGYGAAFLAAILGWNSWLKNRLARTHNVLCIDVWPGTANTTDSAAKSGYINDNTVHYGSVGARLRASLAWTAIQAKWGVVAAQWLPVSNGEVWDATKSTVPSRYPDPLSLNTATSATGPVGVQAGSVLPPGMAMSDCGGGATVTTSVVADPGGTGNAVQLDIVFPTANAYVLLNSRNTGGSFVPGDIIRGGVRVRATGLTGSTPHALVASDNLLTVKVQMKVVDSLGTTYFSVSGDTTAGETGAMVGDLDITQVQWPILLTGASTAQRVQQLIYITNNSNQAGSVRVTLSQFAHYGNDGPVG